MLDFLLVLGQIPFTNIQITYDELVIVFLIFSSIYEYRLRQKAIHRWCKWAWYRLGVNYRRRKRMLRTLVKTKRYRLAVFERRVIRNIKTYLRRRRRAIIHSYLRARRLVRKSIRKSYLWAIDQTYGRSARFLKAAKRRILRRRRLIIQAIYRRFTSVKRAYYMKQVQAERIERQIRRSRPVQAFIHIKNLVSQSV
jgi:hypothetical protein